MPIIESQLDPAWLAAFTDVVTALRDNTAQWHGDLARYARVVEMSLHLTTPQTAAVQSLVSQMQMRPVDDVAGELDAWNVPNGVYEVSGVSETFRYNVHLVTSGDLTGQRVLKRYIEGRYKAFAFITRTGEMKLWRRFASDADELYVTMAEEMLEQVRAIGRDRLFRDRSFTFSARLLTIEFTPRCFRCNVQIPSDTSVGTCYDCRSHAPEYRIEAPERWIDTEAVRRAAQERRERLEASRRELEAQQQAAAAARREQRRRSIPRSEITPTEVR